MRLYPVLNTIFLPQGTYFEREDVALHGFSKFFKKSSLEEREHGSMFMEYQNTRGGKVVFKSVEAPSKQRWDSALEAIRDSLELEKTVNAVRFKGG